MQELQEAGVVSFLLDLQGNIVDCNRLAAGMLGEVPDAVVGRSIEEFGILKGVSREWLAAVRQGERPVHLLTRLAPRGAKPMQMATVAVRSSEDSIQLTGIRVDQGHRSDERSEPRDSSGDHEFNRAIIAGADLARVGIAINTLTDEGNKVAFMNKAGADLLGTTQEAVVDSPAFPPRAEKGADGLVTVDWDANGQRKVFEVGLSSGHYWGRAASFVFFKDVTARDSADAERRRLVNRLEAANEDIKGFARGTTHDLRAPLRSIAGYAALLERRLDGRLDDTEKRLIQNLMRGTKRMDELLDALSGMAAVGRHNVEMTPVDLDEVMAEVVADLSAELSTNVALTIGDLPTVHGDRLLLRQLLQNLTANAVKFRRLDDHQVVVEAECIGEQCTIRVSDNGVGIDLERATGMFQPFRRFHDQAQFPGSGVGLATCRRIVDIHNGSIDVESTPGEGTTFTVLLPN